MAGGRWQARQQGCACGAESRVHERRHEVARAVKARVLQRYGEAALVGSAREAADEWLTRREKLGKRDGCTASREARIFVRVPES